MGGGLLKGFEEEGMNSRWKLGKVWFMECRKLKQDFMGCGMPGQRLVVQGYQSNNSDSENGQGDIKAIVFLLVELTQSHPMGD